MPSEVNNIEPSLAPDAASVPIECANDGPILERFIGSGVGRFVARAAGWYAIYHLILFLIRSVANEFVPHLPSLIPAALAGLSFLLLFAAHTDVLVARLDREFKRFLRTDRNSVTRPLALLIRPFASQRKLDVDDGTLSPLIDAIDLTNSGDLESRLTPLLAKHYVLGRFDAPWAADFSRFERWLERVKIPLGFRFGRVVEDGDNWLDLVIAAAARSDLCIVVPPTEVTSGTAMEIDALLRIDSLLVFLIMPRSSVKLRLPSAQKVDAETLWQNLVACMPSSLDLPSYSKRGGLVSVRNGETKFVQGYRGKKWDNRKSMKAILVQRQLTKKPLVDAVKTATRLIFVLCPAVLVTVVIFQQQMSELFTIDEETSLAVAVAFALAFMISSFWSYCYRFSLPSKLSKTLFVVTVLSLPLSLIVSDWLLRRQLVDDTVLAAKVACEKYLATTCDRFFLDSGIIFAGWFAVAVACSYVVFLKEKATEF